MLLVVGTVAGEAEYSWDSFPVGHISGAGTRRRCTTFGIYWRMRNPEVYAKDDETLKAIAIHEIRNTLQ